MINIPLVSVCVITYNHESFIEHCLSSIITQKTTFPFDIIISDDFSIDQTDIKIQNFIITHPLIDIKYKRQDPNIGVTENFLFVQEKSKSKYIAFCEGDDFWTDENKLQKQYNLLEKNSNISLCFTSRIVVDNKGVFLSEGIYKSKFWSKNEIALGIVPPLQTVFSRNYAKEFRQFLTEHQYSYGMDKIYGYFMVMQGDVFSLKDKTAAYRVHDGGIWSRYNLVEKNKLHIEQSLLFFKAISENKAEEKNLRNAFFKKILVVDLFLLFSDPNSGFQQISFLLKNHKVSLRIILSSFLTVFKYYFGLIAKKFQSN